MLPPPARFVLCPARVVANGERLTELFPGALIHYAMKANGHPAVLRAVIQAGLAVEVASIGELRMLEGAVGKVAPNRVLFGTAVKSVEAIRHFAERGFDHFVVDAPEEIDKIALVAPGSRFMVRAVVDKGNSVFTMSEKFGAPVDLVAELVQHGQARGLRPHGLSFNVGSQAMDPSAWATGIRQLAPVLRQLAAEGLELDALDIGGGYPRPYVGASVNALDEIAALTLQAYTELPYQPTLVLEPGRAMVSDAAWLEGNVVARIRRNGRNWLYLDVGVYNALFESLSCQGSTRYPVELLDERVEPLVPFVLAGPTGDGLDVIDDDARLPTSTGVGDRLRFSDVGSYSTCLASSFNGFEPVPTEVHDAETCAECATLNLGVSWDDEISA
jgi:ornithine decarboxylase